jgi:hypothetical protein
MRLRHPCRIAAVQEMRSELYRSRDAAILREMMLEHE